VQLITTLILSLTVSEIKTYRLAAIACTDFQDHPRSMIFVSSEKQFMRLPISDH